MGPILPVLCLLLVSGLEAGFAGKGVSKVALGQARLNLKEEFAKVQAAAQQVQLLDVFQRMSTAASSKVHTTSCAGAVASLVLDSSTGCMNLVAVSTAMATGVDLESTLTAFCSSDCISNMLDTLGNTGGCDSATLTTTIGAFNMACAKDSSDKLCYPILATSFAKMDDVNFAGLVGDVSKTDLDAVSTAELEIICSPCMNVLINRISSGAFGDAVDISAVKPAVNMVCRKVGGEYCLKSEKFQNIILSDTLSDFGAKMVSPQVMCDQCTRGFMTGTVEVLRAAGTDTTAAAAAVENALGALDDLCVMKNATAYCFDVFTAATEATPLGATCEALDALDLGCCPLNLESLVIRMNTWDTVDLDSTEARWTELKAACATIPAACPVSTAVATVAVSTSMDWTYTSANTDAITASMKADIASQLAVPVEKVEVELSSLGGKTLATVKVQGYSETEVADMQTSLTAQSTAGTLSLTSTAKKFVTDNPGKVMLTGGGTTVPSTGMRGSNPHHTIGAMAVAMLLVVLSLFI